VKTFSPVSVGLFFAFEQKKSSNRLVKYNWQQKEWRNFKYNTEAVEKLLFEFSERIRRTIGILKGLTEATQKQLLPEVYKI
jgi:Fic family protein